MTSKLKTILILFFLNTIVFGQNKPEEIHFLNEFNWKEYELVDISTKKEFLSRTNEFNEFFKSGLYTKHSILNDLHTTDLNGNGRNDIVFDGLSGGEPRRIAIYINEKDGFTKVFDDFQKILKLKFQDNKLSQIWIENRGCCGDPIVELKTYNVSYDNTLPRFEKVIQSRYFSDCSSKLPEKKFDKPKKIEVQNDSYNIRFAPEINNSSDYCWDQITGNIIGSLRKGQIGFSLGESIDDTGRIWWFSAFPPETEIEDCFFYQHGILEDWALGWISSRFVKIIEE